MKRITSKQDRKEQSEKLELALQEEKSQGGSIRRLKSIARDFSEFNLSEFQQAILDSQNVYFGCIQSQYTETQKQKVQQLELLKKQKEGEKVELIVRESYKVTYENNGTEFTLKTFGSKEKAEKCVKGLTLKTLEIEKVETPISTNFTPKEMLKCIHKMESAFYETFTGKHAESLTVGKLKRAIGMELTDKDKEISKDPKHKVELSKVA